MTLREASRATGLSLKAIRRRIERGTLPSKLVDGQRRIPFDVLMEAGLLVTEGSGRLGVDPSEDLGVPRGVGERVERLENWLADERRARQSLQRRVEALEARTRDQPPGEDPG